MCACELDFARCLRSVGGPIAEIISCVWCFAAVVSLIFGSHDNVTRDLKGAANY